MGISCRAEKKNGKRKIYENSQNESHIVNLFPDDEKIYLRLEIEFACKEVLAVNTIYTILIIRRLTIANGHFTIFNEVNYIREKPQTEKFLF